MSASIEVPPVLGPPPLIYWVYVSPDGTLYGDAIRIDADHAPGELVGLQIDMTLAELGRGKE